MLFSIIIPTYNRSHLIADTLNSVLVQEFDDFEVIIVDDGSTDNTTEIVAGFDDPKIKYFKKENGERGAARNFGIDHARGEYLTFLDSDDRLYPEHFSIAERVIKHKPVPVFHLGYEIKDENGTVLKRVDRLPGKANRSLLTGNHFSCIGVFARAEILRKYRFSEDQKFSGTEDWLLWLQLAARFPIHAVNKVTACMINHSERSVMSFDEKSYLYRTEHLADVLSKDASFIETFGKSAIRKIKAHMLTYMALHAGLVKDRKNAYHYLLKGVRLNTSEIFTKRTLVILKHILF